MEVLRPTSSAVPELNAPGLGHIAVVVENLWERVVTVLGAGGVMRGRITDLGSEARPCLCVYLRDPEGNIPELAQARTPRP